MKLFGLIDAEKADYPISLLCRGYSGFPGAATMAGKSPPSKRSREDAEFTERIKEIHHRSRQIYGYPRVHAELRALGVRCSTKRVARLMREEAGLGGCQRRRTKRRTTRRDKHAVPAPDLVSRNFAGTSPDRLWTADITYVGTQEEGFVYISFILDVYYSRKVVGWSMSDHLRTELVVDALEMALWRRKPSAQGVSPSLRSGGAI